MGEIDYEGIARRINSDNKVDIGVETYRLGIDQFLAFYQFGTGKAFPKEKLLEVASRMVTEIPDGRRVRVLFDLANKQ